jgi:hypothetical protein
MRHPNLLYVLLVGGWFGCASPNQKAETTLSEPVRISAHQATRAGQLVLTAQGNISPQPTAVQLAVGEIHLTLETGDRPRLVELALPIGDAQISATQLPPDGLTLKNLSASVETPVALELVHVQDDAIEARATAPIVLHWSAVLSDGTLWPLGPARTPPLELSIDVVTSGATAIADVHASCPGECWTMDGVAQMRDGTLYAESEVQITPR